MADPVYDMMDPTEMEVVAMSTGTASSIGDAVSGRGNDVVEEDDDLYYIPERRPSLDLGTSPMDTGHCRYVEQALPPALSYRSMTSEERSASDDESGSSTGVWLKKTESFSSCYSFDSDDCETRRKVKSNNDLASQPFDTEIIQASDEIMHPSLTVAFTLKTICTALEKLSTEDFKTFKMMLWKRYVPSFSAPLQAMDLLGITDRLLECYNLGVSLQITKNLLKEMGHRGIVDHLETLCIRNEVRHDLCETLKMKYGEVCEDSATPGERRPFDDVFANLLITSTCDNGPNIEHEVMTIAKLDSNREPGELLSTEDILTAEKLEGFNVKLMLIIGVAGSGKSMLVRRLVLDWMEERSHQHVSFLFPLPFRELKQFEDSKISLLEIIQTLYPGTKKLRDEDYRSSDCKMMFVCDGLDEYSGNLDFQNTELLSDFTEPTTLNVIVVNLLRGRLHYRGLFLVTSRPQVTRYVPWDTLVDEVDVRGFLEPEKDNYFHKRFQDPDQAARVIAYVNSFKTFRIMCHLPLFCSLVAAECERIFREHGTPAELPRGITYMYTKLLLALTRQRRRFRAPDCSPDEESDFLVKLGKLAFDMLEQGQFKISKTNWKATDISDVEAVINSGLCTQYITKPFVLSQEKVISFIHPTVQEYLAALYVFLSFINQGRNSFEQPKRRKLMGMLKGPKAMDLYKSAVDRSLPYEDGRLDIFLRFLFGMATKTNRELLQPFCTSSVNWPAFTEDAAALIRKRIRENQHPGRNSNLQHCLGELGVDASEAASS